MKHKTPARYPVMALAAGLLVLPIAAQAQRDGTPGNPPGTAVGRAIDRAIGTPTSPDGTPGNPPSTVTGRAADTVLGTPSVPDGTPGNPPGSAADRGATAAATAVQSALTPAPASPLATPLSTTSAPLRAPVNTPASLAMPASLATAGSALLMRPRLSQIIGGNVYNDRNERVGEVDDILLTHSASGDGNMPAGPIAVLQIGGFLGMGGRLVAVPLGDLRWNTERSQMVMPGATKEAMQTRTVFDYASIRSR